MATARKPRPRSRPTPPQCKPCEGTGEVSRTVRVGRKHREVGEQTGICLNCFGTGQAPTA